MGNVNKSYGEFRIDVPDGSVFFSGDASIGIEANTSTSQIHAFEGSCKLRKGFAFDGAQITVHEGESAGFEMGNNGQVQIVRSNADESTFASTRSMSVDRLNLNDAYREQVIRSEPRIYWRFDGGRIVENEISDEFCAKMKGDVHWTRFGNNVSPEFGLSVEGDAFVAEDFWPEHPLDEYTIEFWAKPSHYHNGAMFGLCVPETAHHALLVEIGAPYHKHDYHTRPNRFRFLHRVPPARRGGNSCYGEDAYQVRTWQHVVARKQGNQLELLINGELVSSSLELEPLPAGLEIVIGQLFPHTIERSFFGQIDEVAVYERALSDDEINTHFNSARNDEATTNPRSDSSGL